MAFQISGGACVEYGSRNAQGVFWKQFIWSMEFLLKDSWK